VADDCTVALNDTRNSKKNGNKKGGAEMLRRRYDNKNNANPILI